MYLRNEKRTYVESVDDSSALVFKNTRLGNRHYLFLLEVRYGEEIVEIIYGLNSRVEKLEGQAHAYGRHLLRQMGMGRAEILQVKIYGEYE